NPKREIAPQKILAPVDFSNASKQGLAVAGPIAERFGAKIEIMYSAEPPSLPEWGYALLEFRDIELQRSAAQKMEQFIKESPLSHNLIGGTIVRSVYPENQICLVA